MAAIELNLNPTTKQLRQFGLIGLFALPLIGWLFAGKPTAASWLPAHTQWVGAFAAVGGVMGLLALIRPTFLKWVFIGLSIVTFPIGFVLGEVLMFAIYMFTFLPMAMIFRMIGRDALDHKLESDVDSYWQAKQQPKDAASYFRQS